MAYAEETERIARTTIRGNGVHQVRTRPPDDRLTANPDRATTCLPLSSGSCVNNICAQAGPNERFKGDPCDNDSQCVEDGVYCSPVDGICGGEQAQCQRDEQSPSEIGESDDCASGRLYWALAV